MRYLIDTHTHTLASGHAYNTIDEMTRKAADIGLFNIAFTEHAPKMPGSCGKLYFSNYRVLPKEKYGVRRFFGCEANITDYQGKLDLSDGYLQKMDIVIASFHIPCIKPATIKEHTVALLKVMDNPHVHIIGHPDDNRYELDMETLVKAAKEKHKLLELNNTSLKPEGPRSGARANDLQMLDLCKKYDVCIALGSDAHVEEDICNFTYAEELLTQVSFPERLIVNLDMDLLETYLRVGGV